MASNKRTNKHKNLKDTISNVFKVYIILAVALALALIIFLVAYKYFIKPDHFIIQNQYYGFSIVTPRSWIGEENTDYSESNISEILANCRGSNSNAQKEYEIGHFRFKSRQYPQDIDIYNLSTTGLPSGIVLEIKVSCLSGAKDADNLNDEKIDANSLSGSGLDSRRFIFFHDDLKYSITGYINISPNDKSDNKLEDNYNSIINQVISSFNFI